MKVKCISRAASNEQYGVDVLQYRHLTIGKIYDVTYYSNYSYKIIDDGNLESQFRKECFIDIQKLRHDKLNELGI